MRRKENERETGADEYYKDCMAVEEVAGRWLGGLLRRWWYCCCSCCCSRIKGRLHLEVWWVFHRKPSNATGEVRPNSAHGLSTAL